MATLNAVSLGLIQLQSRSKVLSTFIPDPKVIADLSEPPEEPFLKLMSNPSIRRASAQQRPLMMVLEITDKCAGGCNYCFSNSTLASNVEMPKEKIIELIDQAVELKLRHITWPGGDPLLHHNFMEVMTYSGQKGLHNYIVLSGLISKKNASDLYDLYQKNYLHMLSVHIDSTVPESYNRLHTSPKSLDAKKQGYQNLLDAGIPASAIGGCICLTSESLTTFEETFDWFVSMGANWINLLPFKPTGFGDLNRNLEPKTSVLKKAFEYRAKIKGKDWERVGPMECGQFHCRTLIYVTFDGKVAPCAFFRESTVVGNIFEEKLTDILQEKSKKRILLYDHEIKGACATCKNNEICFGCRSNAEMYLNDQTASDPKCWLNPDAKELYFAEQDKSLPVKEI
jgi:radical SAM protein with 4Fe4S-binding SPASM domain